MFLSVRKSLAAALAALAILAAPAGAAWYGKLALRDHGHTGPGDGGALSAVAITSATFSTATVNALLELPGSGSLYFYNRTSAPLSPALGDGTADYFRFNGTSGVTTQYPFIMTPYSTAYTPLIVRGNFGQTADLFQIEDYTSTDLMTITAGGVVRVPDGTNSVPGLSFPGDTNTGLVRYASDNFGASAGGVKQMEWDSNGAAFYNQLRAGSNGTAAAPRFTSTAGNTGAYFPTSTTYGLSAGGVSVATASSTGWTFNVPVTFSTGSISSHVRAILDLSETIPTDTVYTIPWDTEIIDTLNEFNGSTFTATYAGIYRVTGKAIYTCGTTGSRYFGISVNGDAFGNGSSPSTQLGDLDSGYACSTPTLLDFTGEVKLSAGGTISFVAAQNSGTDKTIQDTSSGAVTIGGVNLVSRTSFVITRIQ